MRKGAKQEKILRIGIVQGGRIIEERLLRHKEAVTIGQSPKNKFMIPSPRVPVSYRLVDVRGGKYILCFEKGMRGKVLVGDEVLDLKAIAMRKLAARKDAHFSFPLNEESRGKIVLGDVTLLFQFVTPPPQVPKLQLPAEAKGAWWRNVDRALLNTFLLSLVVLGGWGGGLDVWWRETGRYMAPAARKTPKVFQTLVTAAVRAKEDKSKMDEKGKKKEEDEKGIQEPNPDEKKRGDDSAKEELPIAEGEGADLGISEGQEFDESALDAAVEAAEGIDIDDMRESMEKSFREPEEAKPSRALSQEERMERAKALVTNRTVVGIMGSDWGIGEGGFVDGLAAGVKKHYGDKSFGEGVLDVGTPGGLSSDYLDESDGIGEIAEGMSSPDGPEGSDGSGGGGPRNLIGLNPGQLRPGGGPGSKGVIVGPKKKLEPEKKEIKEKRWTLSLRGPRSMVGGKIDRKAIDKYLKARTSAFQRCYTMIARKNPNVGGKLKLQIKIGLEGRGTAKVLVDETGDPALAKCIIGKIKQWMFPKPEGKPVEFPISFVFRAL